ncbi:MAG TPA: methylated-DNA--[protein]-cysteine S-methyltransferase [Candidatus Thermoplasmatota archaeon]|nr:methylated-DNA--[protein]-cysteine S-methyltransferase [Candidatus Thermoplasmatota archaeon]
MTANPAATPPSGSYARVQTPLGWLHIAVRSGAVVQTSMPGEPRDRFLAGLADRFPGVGFREEPRDPLLLRASHQVLEYFQGRRRSFDLPLDPGGTTFQARVWRSLGAIPYGAVRSYRDVAQSVGRPGAFRAVGQANHANPIPLIIPCHRVIAADGTLGGYGGGLRMKQQLLSREGVEL